MAFGQIAYYIVMSSVILLQIPATFQFITVSITCTIIFIFWEVLENYLIYQYVSPYRKDTLKNSLSDLVFGFIGLLMAYYLPFEWIIFALVIEFGCFLFYERRLYMDRNANKQEQSKTIPRMKKRDGSVFVNPADFSDSADEDRRCYYCKNLESTWISEEDRWPATPYECDHCGKIICPNCSNNHFPYTCPACGSIDACPECAKKLWILGPTKELICPSCAKKGGIKKGQYSP